MLAAPDYSAAAAISRELDGKGISKQAFNIYAKIREVDEALYANSELRARVREVHPEICFWAWNGGCPMLHAKKSTQGRADRRILIADHFGPGAFAAVRAAHRRAQASDDDIADAFAALWTAERIHAGQGATLPPDPPQDSRGLRMGMWY